MSGFAHGLRLLFILGGSFVPVLLLWQAFGGEGDYRAPPSSGARNLTKAKYEKLYSREWRQKLLQAEIASVQAQIDKAEAQLAIEMLAKPQAE
jgi:hypothetical protein